MHAIILIALVASPATAAGDCSTYLADGAAALAAFDAPRAEEAFRRAEEICASRDSAAQLGGLLYDRSMDAPKPLRPALLREAHSFIRLAFARGDPSGELFTIRAAIEGDLAQVSDSSTEQAKLLLAVHNDAIRARRLDPDGSMPLVVLGAWHRNAAALSFKERLYIRMVAGSLPSASLDESRRLLELAVARDKNAVTLYFLGATHVEQGDLTAARNAFTQCAASKPKSLRESFVREWCRTRLR